jgi:sugar lactone lactonase YvrE
VNLSWEVAVPARAELGERPVWDARAGCLVWVDIHAGQVHGYRPAGSDRVIIDAGLAVGAAMPRRGGGYVLAAADGFRLADRAGRLTDGPLRPPGMADDVRFNDGSCDPAGRFWAGTVAVDRRGGGGALYRLDRDGTVALVLDGVTESNGIGWSPAGTTMYYIDSGEEPARIRAFRFDPDSGAVSGERDLVTVPPSDGVPDGLTVDAAGTLWVAIWGGGQVRRYAPSGEELGRLPVPVSQPSCPGFGGADLSGLYLTTAWEGMSRARRGAEPHAGHLLRAKVASRPETERRGRAAGPADGLRGLPVAVYGR